MVAWPLHKKHIIRLLRVALSAACGNACTVCYTLSLRAIGAAGAQVLYTHKVGGSNPSSPTTETAGRPR